MKLTAPRPEPGSELSQNLYTDLGDLTEKHARQMQNMLADSAKKLAKNLARLLAKE